MQQDFPKTQDDIKVLSLSWNINRPAKGNGWSFWSTPSPYNTRTALGLRASGGWCQAVLELLTYHLQRPLFYT